MVQVRRRQFLIAAGVLIAAPLAVQSANPVPPALAVAVTLSGPSAPATTGAMITVTGTITGTRNGYAIPKEYATAQIGVYRVVGGNPEFLVPVIWTAPLPALLNSGQVLSFTTSIPADRLLLRCVPRLQRVCSFDLEGPLLFGRSRRGGDKLEMGRTSVSVMESASEQARWSTSRVEDKGTFKGGAGYEPGVVLVGFPAGVSLDAAERVISIEGFKIKNTFPSDGPGMAIIFPPNMTIEDVMAKLQPRLKFAEPNRLICSADYRAGIVVYLEAPLEKSVVVTLDSGKKQETLKPFTYPGNAHWLYQGAHESPGEYVLTVTAAGYEEYREKIELKRDDCHVITATRRLRLKQMASK